MTVMIIDGPEKVGKTTTIRFIQEALEDLGMQSDVTHWGLVQDFPDYVEKLKDHTAKRNFVHIWDRSWASEYVYGRLLDRQSHTMTADPWLGAWCLDRAADANGLKVIFTPASFDDILSHRDTSDIPVSPRAETKFYEDYGKRFGWDVRCLAHKDNDARKHAEELARKIVGRMNIVTDPTRICGPVGSPVLFIGETKSSQYIRGGFLPFTSRYTTMFGRDIGDKAIQSRWSNISDVVPEDFALVDLVVLCGQAAYTKYYNDIGKEVRPRRVLPVPHPSYLYRYNTPEVRRAKEVALELVHSEIKEI